MALKATPKDLYNRGRQQGGQVPQRCGARGACCESNHRQAPIEM
jgi:hypothetical protein